MKVAEARYVGASRTHYRNGPSGEEYRFRRTSDGSVWLDVENVEDAQHLAEQMNIELRWKPLGRIKAASEGASAAIAEWSYRQKQRAVDDLGLDVALNSQEEDLERALHEHVEELHNEGDL